MHRKIASIDVLSRPFSSIPPRKQSPGGDARAPDETSKEKRAVPEGRFPERSEVAHKRVLFFRGASIPSKLIEETLRAGGFRVVVVTDLDELREEMYLGACDLVLIDPAMPIAQKLFFLQTTRDETSPIPVILLFEPGADEEAAHAKACGAADCVVWDEFGEYLIKIPALIDVFARESGLSATDDLVPNIVEEPAPVDRVDEQSCTQRIDLTGLAEEVRGTALETTRASLVVLSGPDVGKTVRLDCVKFTIGRDPSCQLVLCDGSVSRFHVSIKLIQGGVVRLKDLGSTNGTFIGGERIQSADLKEGDKILIGRNTLIGFQHNDAIDTNYHEELYTYSTRDGLTGIYNRRSCLERIRTVLAYAKRHRRPASILMFDVDHFKHINDRFGHRAGDMVLKNIATVTGKSIREEDILGRYGGEEFILFALDTDLEGAKILAERIRKKIEQCEMQTEEDVPRTVFTSVSIGISTAAGETTYELDALIQAADENLYKAKERGRNCTVASVVPTGFWGKSD